MSSLGDHLLLIQTPRSNLLASVGPEGAALIGEVETAPDRRAAAEMVLIRLCHVSDLPPPGDLVRRLTSGAASPDRNRKTAQSGNRDPSAVFG